MDIKNRRTIRRYTTQGVDNQLLTRLLQEASQTPTMGNLQLYSVVVTRDAAAKQRLAPAHFNQPMVTQAPVVLTFCADFRRTTLWAKERQATPGYDNFLSFINAATDTLLYCQSFCNLAEAEGLGTCFLGTTVYQPDALIDALQLPRLVMPVATITLGWPDEQPALQDRLPIEAILHEEHYHDYTPASIDRCYAEKESLEVNREFVRINHKETLAQVFTDLRYTKKDNEAMSDGLIKAFTPTGLHGLTRQLSSESPAIQNLLPILKRALHLNRWLHLKHSLQLRRPLILERPLRLNIEKTAQNNKSEHAVVLGCFFYVSL